MKIFILLIFSLALSYAGYAGQNSLVANYPASQGSYSQINVVIPPGAGANPLCTNPANTGALFRDYRTGNLSMCINNRLVDLSVQRGCFNRFCSRQSATPKACILPLCPSGYNPVPSMAGVLNAFMADSTDPGPSYWWVTYGVCCATGQYNAPS